MITREGQKEIFDFVLFDEETQERLMPDWLVLAEMVDLTDEVVHTAVTEWLPRLKDCQFKGVRMALGACLREFAEIGRFRRRLAEGEDVRSCYGVLPAILSPYQALKYAGGDNVYVAFPDMVLMKAMQEIFHHAHHLFAKAEESGFSYGARHCALNKLGIAGRLTGIVPIPTVMWSWGLVCDEATKVDEYLKRMMKADWVSVVTRLPHDTYDEDIDFEKPERVQYLGGSIRRGIEVASEAMGITVTDQNLADAVADYNRYMGKVGALGRMTRAADPVPLRNTTSSILSLPASIPFNSGLQYLEEAVDVLTQELAEAIERGEGLAPKGHPKVGMYFNPSQNAWFDDLLIQNGVVVTMGLPSTMSKAQLTPSTLEDPYEQMAEQWLKMNFGMGCGADVRNWCEKIEASGVDAMIVGFLDYDRWLGQVQKVGAQLVEERLGIPTFYVEGDFYDDRDYSEEALKTRVESICQIIKMRKAMQ